MHRRVFYRRICCLAMALTLLVSFKTELSAAYTYEVTLSAGNRAVFSDGTDEMTFAPGPDGRVDLTEAYLELDEYLAESGSKYYCKGVIRSGRDASDGVDLPNIDVKRDEIYVAVYGIRGDMVPYTIKYLDVNGNELHDSRTLYGNVGDQPVVAAVYIEGYLPEARNLKGTLEKDSPNEFTFTYYRVSGGRETIVTIEGDGTEGETVIEAEGGNTVVMPGGGAGGTMVVPGAEGAAAGAGEAGAAAGEGTAEAVQQPRELINLDEEETPLAAGSGENEPEESMDAQADAFPVAWVAAAAVMLILLLAVIVLVTKKKKEKEEKEEKTREEGPGRK